MEEKYYLVTFKNNQYITIIGNHGKESELFKKLKNLEPFVTLIESQSKRVAHSGGEIQSVTEVAKTTQSKPVKLLKE